RQVIDVKLAIGKRIAFVGIIVLVLGQHVIALELKAIAEAFAKTKGQRAIERLTRAARYHHLAQLGSKYGIARRVELSVDVQEASQVDALRVCEVGIERPVRRQ